MYPIPLSEHLIENKTCKKCSALFPITDKDMEFYAKVSPTFGGKKYLIPAPKLPDTIEWIPDDILNWAIECEVSGKPFRIIKQKLEFYRKHSLPIPKRHPDVRHLDRMKMRNPRKLFERKCDKRSRDMITTYSRERPEKVYCEECYNREVLS